MKQTFQLPKTITLTDAAADRVKHIMAQSDENYLGVRLGLKNAGCAGMEYTMEYATEILPQDEVVEDKGVTVLVDLKAVLFLIGTEIDYVETMMSSGFEFNSPLAKNSCGCGESVGF